MYPSDNIKADLDRQHRTWIDEAQTEHDNYVSEMNEVENYMDGDQVPSGFSQEHKVLFSAANNPMTPIASRRNYIVINQVTQTHESILGNFVKAKLTTNYYPTGIRDAKKIEPIRKGMKYIENKNKTFQRVVFPATDSMLSKALGWAKLWHDPYENLPNGRIKEAYVSPRDVLVPPDSRDFFYEDTRYRIHRIKMLVEDAKEEFRWIDGLDVEGFKSDMDWLRGVPKDLNSTDQSLYCTIYEIQCRKKESVYKLIDGNDVHEITLEQYQRYRSDKTKEVFVDRDDVYYIAYWNSNLQTFYYEKSAYQCFTLIPCISRRSENRVYPVMDFTYYKNLQDLYNIIITILADDAKEGRKFLIGVDPATYTTKKDVIEKAIREGDSVIPVVNSAQVLNRPGVTEGVLMLMNFVKQSIDSLRSLPAVTQGELPAKQISEETVKTLINTALASHGRKDMMINYFMTELARARFAMMVTTWTDRDWIRATDVKKGDPQFVPINFEIEGEEKYTQFLAELSGIEFPQQGEIPPEVAQQFLAFKKKFEAENDVQVETVQRVHYDGNHNYFTNDEYVKHIQQTQMSPSEFVNKYNVERKNIPRYIINELSPDIDVDIETTVEFDVDKNKARQQALTMNFADRQWLTPVDTMTELGIEDAEGKWERAKAMNQNLMVAERLQKDQNFQQAVGLAEKIASDPKMMQAITAAYQPEPQQ